MATAAGESKVFLARVAAAADGRPERLSGERLFQYQVSCQLMRALLAPCKWLILRTSFAPATRWLASARVRLPIMALFCSASAIVLSILTLAYPHEADLQAAPRTAIVPRQPARAAHRGGRRLPDRCRESRLCARVRAGASSPRSPLLRGLAPLQRPLRSGRRVVSPAHEPGGRRDASGAAPAPHLARRGTRGGRDQSDPRPRGRHRLFRRDPAHRQARFQPGRRGRTSRSRAGLQPHARTSPARRADARQRRSARRDRHRQGTRGTPDPRGQSTCGAGLSSRSIVRG
jgi:hypothetical protein